MILRVILDVPVTVHADRSSDSVPSNQEQVFDYSWDGPAQIGQRVIVPWGRQTVMGLIVELAHHTRIEPSRLRFAKAVLDDLAPLSQTWLELVRFAARYYQRGLGEVALPTLPTLLRRPTGYRLTDGLYRSKSVMALHKRASLSDQVLPDAPVKTIQLNAEQDEAIRAIKAKQEKNEFAPILLHGVTGSGKTEVYLAAIGEAMARQRQVLVLVPEINLTPQLEQRFRIAFPAARIATLHSALADGERARNWLRAFAGVADLLIGTRMAVMTPLPRLALIVVDEEHDPSFKQQEGLRYSARDLALVLAQQQRLPIILGSATPSLESWWRAKRGHYLHLTLSRRAQDQAKLPAIEVHDVSREALEHGFSVKLREEIAQCLARGEQSLVFLNRRGYAPVVTCNACGWISKCPRCSVHAVFHKSDRLLHCHHCGWRARPPRACPDCGNLDLAPLGRGTQRIEETLSQWYPQARIARIDRDSTQRKGSAGALFDAVHRGEVDILVGTQMVAKGHDFQNLTLVGVLDADTGLFSHDFRASERLFANLMQVAGRAGRADKPGKVVIQTQYPTHPLFQALRQHDYTSFATSLLEERQQAQLPPYSHQAVLRAEATTLDEALAFVAQARSLAVTCATDARLSLYDPVPMAMPRRAGVERAQMLIESPSRPALQAFLLAWLLLLRAQKSRITWHLEVDPLEI